MKLDNMMEMRAKLRRGIVRRKCSQMSKASIKRAKRESLKRISTILRKNESCRSAEEKAVLCKMTEEVRQVKYRLCQQQKIIERNKEVEDDLSVLKTKCKKLANALQRANHLVVYTGAGISTAADIPDYRGPNGIWTLLQQGKKIGKHDLTKADPTSTHMALWQLYRKRYLKFVVSQNCDGLHLRSGLPRRALSEVHGNMYIEICKECKPNVQYWRLFDTTERTARFYHKTGRICHVCGSPLVDSIVHFGEKGIAQWPLNWAGALHHAAKADVILCLGSSLKVLKKYSWLWAMDRPAKKRPAIFIVNLQWTPKDYVAELKINGKCDTVMKLVMEYIGLEVPKYDRSIDPIFGHSSHLSPKELHTTTQPMLFKISNNTPKQEEATKKQENCEQKQEEIKPMEVDEDEDDCPLNVLKDKIFTNNCERSFEKAIDLTIGEVKRESDTESNIFNVMNVECQRSNSTLCKTYNDGVDTHVKVRGVSVDIKEETKVMTTTDSKNYHQSNLQINAVINKSFKTELECSDRNSNSHTAVEGISMKILTEEFERVHVEMKTDENEIRKVSILLVNKPKTSPKKCDKAQQTDPEPFTSDILKLNKDPPPDLKHFDTGQMIQDLRKFNKKLEPQDPVNKQLGHINVQTKNISSHIYINSHHVSAQINANKIQISTDSDKVVNLSCETNCANRTVNPLRSFRRVKEVQKACGTEIDIKLNAASGDSFGNTLIKTEIEETILNNYLNSEGPVDYSLKSLSEQIRIPKYNAEVKFNNSYILKVPKPPVACYYKHYIPSVNSEINGVLDLSLRGKTRNHFDGRIGVIKRPMIGIRRSITDNCFESSRVVDDFENFTQQCEILAKVIIQNTLEANHKELQRAYSGLHSIINPIPFNIQYDFKNVFNALNFINLGKKLMLKERLNVLPKRSSRIRDIAAVSSNVVSGTKPKSRYENRIRFSKKREPTCNFCYEKYKSVVCNFYVSHNSDNRFVRNENGKLYMCICCADSEESSSESDDDVSLMERKRRLESKNARKIVKDSKKESKNIELNGNSEMEIKNVEQNENGATESKNVEQNVNSVMECKNVEQNKNSVMESTIVELSEEHNKMLGESKLDDLEGSVQSINKEDSCEDSVQSINKEDSCESKDEHVQAGWFGKGFRKNRRRKR